MMYALQPKMRNINVIQPNAYAQNLTRSPSCDMAILPSGGGGYMKKKIDGEKLDEGNFKPINADFLIKGKVDLRNILGVKMDINQVKLPRPVVISNFKTVQQQVLKNVADVNYFTINDLSEQDRNSVLSNARLDDIFKEVNPVQPKIDILTKKVSSAVPIDVNGPAYQQLARALKNEEQPQPDKLAAQQNYIKYIQEQIKLKKQSKGTVEK